VTGNIALPPDVVVDPSSWPVPKSSPATTTSSSASASAAAAAGASTQRSNKQSTGAGADADASAFSKGVTTEIPDLSCAGLLNCVLYLFSWDGDGDHEVCFDLICFDWFD
jgi:hypothetical protein